VEIPLYDIPLIDTGPDFPYETLCSDEPRGHLLIDGATRGVPRQALKILDGVSRRWLAKWNNSHLAEIDRIAARLGRPGAYFLSVNYEWGCTVGVCPSPDGQSARLVRVLDWRTPGLGRHVMAARVAGVAGSFITLTWPGYTGVLQASAPGRFAAAINQAPLPRSGGGFFPFDWLSNKLKLWQMPHDTPAHVLRHVFEEAPDFATARRALIETPLASPAIFSLAGVGSDKLCIIERTEDRAYVHDGLAAAANAWRAPSWEGHSRGHDNPGREAQMKTVRAEFVAPSSWLKPPILSDLTRLVMVAEPATGRMLAQGYEASQPATALLDIPANSTTPANLAN